jgi:glycosyltransferase involved in cell wall biosynthesis
VIFEAWDAGCIPVAYAKSGGAAEIIEASGGGLLYADQSPACLADAIKGALSHTTLEREAMVARGRAWMKEHCSPERYAHEILTILSAASSKHPV